MLTTGSAQPDARLGLGPAALEAKSLLKPCFGAAAVALALGGAGFFGVAVARDARGPATGCTCPVGETFLVGTGPAQPAVSLRRTGAATSTKSGGRPLGVSPAVTVAVAASAFVGILDGHGLVQAAVVETEGLNGRTDGATLLRCGSATLPALGEKAACGITVELNARAAAQRGADYDLVVGGAQVPNRVQ
ncbi:MAG: hypothetical protein OXC19_19960 [Bryobacterales bacterium]|nr:hypothetical protein [Bryobacterales bacterium]